MRRFLSLAALAAALLSVSGCYSIDIDDDRVPRMAVYVPFTTEADWHTYGVGGALDSRIFIREERIPANYAYPDYSYTGYGGLLLTMDINNQPLVFDLACPVERQPGVKISISRETNLAYCSQCGSTFDVFSTAGGLAGAPVEGIALAEGYALRRYRVVFGADGRYALLTP